MTAAAFQRVTGTAQQLQVPPMIGPAFRPGHDVIHRQAAEREGDPASVAVSFLLTVEHVPVRPIRRGLALIGPSRDVGACDDLAEKPMPAFDPMGAAYWRLELNGGSR